MFDLNIYLSGLVIALLLPLLTWIVSLFKRDVSIVDSLWSLIFLALIASYFYLSEFTTPRGQFVSPRNPRIEEGNETVRPSLEDGA